MATLELFFSFQLLLIFIFFLTTGRASACPASSCPHGPPVRFPFWLKQFQPSSCGYRGFELSCNNQTQMTTITLPGSGDFPVYFIDYKAQELWITDPNRCFPKRFIDRSFSLRTLHNDTPFDVVPNGNYTFLNCSSSQALQNTTQFPDTAEIVSCLSNVKYTVFAVPSNKYDNWLQPSSPSPSPSPSPSTSMCSIISSAIVPTAAGYEWRDRFGQGINGVIVLTWDRPYCKVCEARGEVCELNTDTYQTVCSDRKGQSHGLSRGVKYGLIIGVGIPGLLCIIGLANYVWTRITAHGRPNQPITDLSASTAQQPATVIVGLDGPTIESYPKTLLGESRRLPKPNDNTCSICLSEYQPKEALRTIPECNHYFHASCIDEWLKMNATCPVCRNSPEGSSLVTPSSLSSSSSSSSLASTTRI